VRLVAEHPPPRAWTPSGAGEEHTTGTEVRPPIPFPSCGAKSTPQTLLYAVYIWIWLWILVNLPHVWLGSVIFYVQESCLHVINEVYLQNLFMYECNSNLMGIINWWFATVMLQ
jgi:hypothetical protein